MLPQRTPDDPVHIVVPNSTQMGWVESMYVFCAASETVRDIGEVLLREDSLPAHKLEEVILPKVVQSPITESFDPATFLQMLEVYIDNFITIAQVTNVETLRHVTRALLHAIDSLFPDSVSISKLQKEGAWETRKEILG